MFIILIILIILIVLDTIDTIDTIDTVVVTSIIGWYWMIPDTCLGKNGPPWTPPWTGRRASRADPIKCCHTQTGFRDGAKLRRLARGTNLIDWIWLADFGCWLIFMFWQLWLVLRLMARMFFGNCPCSCFWPPQGSWNDHPAQEAAETSREEERSCQDRSEIQEMSDTRTMQNHPRKMSISISTFALTYLNVAADHILYFQTDAGPGLLIFSSGR